VVLDKIEAGPAAKSPDDITYRVGLSDGSLFFCALRYLPPEYRTENFFTSGRNLSDDETAALRQSSTCLRAEKAALNLVARAEQYNAGLRCKLYRKGYDKASIEMVLGTLAERGFLDDKRYALAWIRYRIILGDSPRKIKLKLEKKGLDRALVEESMAESLDSETERALLQKFLGLLKLKEAGVEGDSRNLRKQLRFEGFSKEILEEENCL
jgi:regulatory protein